MANLKDKYAEAEAKRIGENVKRLRERAKWTQAELAQISGTSATYLSALERGERRPGANLMARLCESFGVEERVIRYGNEEDVGVDVFTREDLELLHMLKADPEAYLAAKDIIRLDREKIFRVRTRIKNELAANGDTNGSAHI